MGMAKPSLRQCRKHLAEVKEGAHNLPPARHLAVAKQNPIRPHTPLGEPPFKPSGVACDAVPPNKPLNKVVAVPFALALPGWIIRSAWGEQTQQRLRRFCTTRAPRGAKRAPQAVARDMRRLSSAAIVTCGPRCQAVEAWAARACLTWDGQTLHTCTRCSVVSLDEMGAAAAATTTTNAEIGGMPS